MCVHRSIKSVLSNTESEGRKSRSPGSSAWACFNPCCNTISVLKVSAAAQVHSVAATVHLICWYTEPALCLWASEPLGFASTKLALKQSNWWKELGKYCIHLHWRDKWGYESPYKYQYLSTHNKVESCNFCHKLPVCCQALFLLQWALNILQSRRIPYLKSEFTFILQTGKQNKGHISK